MGKLLSVLVLFAVGAAAAVAQTTAPAAGARTAREANTISVTGCLRAEEQPGSFLLAVARVASGTAAREDPATRRDGSARGRGASAPPRPVERGETLLSRAAPGVELADHVGHTITIAGARAPADPEVRPGIVFPDTRPPGEAPSQDTDAGREAAAHRVLSARTLTHVSADCR